MFAQRFKELRLEHEINQKDLGDILSTSTSTIGMWEQGRRSPDKDMLVKIADYFNVSVDYLLGRTDEKFSIQDLGLMFSITMPKNSKQEFPVETIKKLMRVTRSKENTMKLVSYAEKFNFNATENVAYTINLKDSNKQVKLTVDQITSLLNYFDSVGIDVEKSLEKSSINSEKEND